MRKAKEILESLNLYIGTADPRQIEAVDAAWDDDDDCVWVDPNSELERAGLVAHRNYTFDQAMRSLGCEEW